MSATAAFKTCPQCQAQVRDATRTCRHCRHEFGGPRFHDLGPVIGWFLAGAVLLGWVWQATH